MSEYGMNEIPSNQFKRIARGYAEKIVRLRRSVSYPLEPEDGVSDAEYERIVNEAMAQRDAKIARLTDKLRAMVKELLRRVGLPNLPLSIVNGTRTTFPLILANCPICHNTVNFADSVVFIDGRLGLKCPSCGVERWET